MIDQMTDIIIRNIAFLFDIWMHENEACNSNYQIKLKHSFSLLWYWIVYLNWIFNSKSTRSTCNNFKKYLFWGVFNSRSLDFALSLLMQK